MEGYKQNTTTSFETVVLVLNKSILPVQRYPLYRVSVLSSSTDTRLDKRLNKKWLLAAPIVESIHRHPRLHLMSGWMSGFCAFEGESQKKVLRIQCRKQGEPQCLEKCKNQPQLRASWNIRKDSARAGSPSASHWLSEIKEDVNSSLTQA